MDFQERYTSGNTPWEIHRVDSHLVKTVTKTPILPCNALDIGCGIGNSVIWLQQQGFTATGIDSSEFAIQRAQEKAHETGVNCELLLIDFFNTTLPGSPFDFVFDRGCFHHPQEPDQLKRFAENVAHHLTEDGLWLTLTGNCDETREGPGPPQLSASQIVQATESSFEILTLVTDHFDTNQDTAAKNWVCLMRKRRK
jgi:2-polyprenyl-3-methyl-5-hydroxy-6-metoxy-1,4-benzoquinol methylase